MTKEELKNLKYRKMRLDDLKERIDILWTKITSITAELSDMPKGGGAKSELKEEYCDLKEIYESEKSHLELDIVRTERWISDIAKEEPFVATALTKKYIDGKKWYQVAVDMNSNEDAVKQMCHRFLDKIIVSTM